MPEAAQPGDFLKPIPLWNSSSRPANHLPDAVRIEAVRIGTSETGIEYQVKIDGREAWLDSGWFLPGKVDGAQFSEPGRCHDRRGP